MPNFAQRTLLALAFLFSLTAVSYAQFNTWVGGSSSVRNSAMGGALSAVPDEFDEVTLNPANIGLLGGSNFSFSENFIPANVLDEHFVYSQRLPGGDGFSLGGDFTSFTSTFYGLNVYAGYGLHLTDNLRMGLSAHFIDDNFTGTSADMTGAMDAGIYYRLPKSPLSIAVVANNIGFDLDYASLPMYIRTGWAYQVNLDGNSPYNEIAADNSRLTLAGQGNWSVVYQSQDTIGVGAEYSYKGVAFLRAGYQFADYTDSPDLTGFSWGAGLRAGDLQADYSMTIFDDAGTTNQVSLGLALGGEGKPTPAPTPKPTPAPTPEPTVVATATSVATPEAEEAEEPTEVATPVPVVTHVDEEVTPGQPLTPMRAKFHSAMSSYANHDYKTAYKDLQASLDHPGEAKWRYAESYAMLGIISEFYSHSKGHIAKAKEYYRKALKLDPKNVTAKKHLHD